MSPRILNWVQGALALAFMAGGFVFSFHDIKIGLTWIGLAITIALNLRSTIDQEKRRQEDVDRQQRQRQTDLALHLMMTRSVDHLNEGAHALKEMAHELSSLVEDHPKPEDRARVIQAFADTTLLPRLRKLKAAADRMPTGASSVSERVVAYESNFLSRTITLLKASEKKTALDENLEEARGDLDTLANALYDEADKAVQDFWHAHNDGATEANGSGNQKEPDDSD